MKLIRNPKTWLEAKISNPHEYLDSALVIHGPKGNGKTIAAKLICQRFRYSFFGNLLPSVNFGGALMEDRNIIVYDDFLEHPSEIKDILSFIKKERIEVHVRGEDSYTIRNKTGFIFLTEDSKRFTDIDDNRFIPATPMDVFAILSGIPIK